MNWHGMPFRKDAPNFCEAGDWFFFLKLCSFSRVVYKHVFRYHMLQIADESDIDSQCIDTGHFESMRGLAMVNQSHSQIVLFSDVLSSFSSTMKVGTKKTFCLTTYFVNYRTTTGKKGEMRTATHTVSVFDQRVVSNLCTSAR